MGTATIMDSYVLIKPSKSLCSIIKQLEPDLTMPRRIKYLVSNQFIESNEDDNSKNSILLTSDDYENVKSLSEKYETSDYLTDITTNEEIKTFSSDNKNEGFLHVEDLMWLYTNLNSPKISLHELLEDSVVFVPENKQIERNPVLEKRCERLKIQQENKIYKSMTKNIDNVRMHHPEDTIGYQIKQFDKQLIAVFQFIVSVATGFAFGFIGVELMVGPLDFGFKLLLGIICSLVIALAELYFLAKQLNET